MDDQHVRSRRVLDPEYLADLDARSVDELRTMRAECGEIEVEVSYVRRIAHARIDILEAEIERRARGGSLEDLIRALPEILADPGPRAAPANSRLAYPVAPAQESEWEPELHAVEAAIADLPALSADELHTASGRLRSLEHEVSAQRRRLHTVLERIEHALAQRLTADAG